MRNKNAFNAPLQHGDTENQTVGCRHTNPGICAKHSVPGKCAFTSNEKICLTPPASWSKKFKMLQSEKEQR
jgi:hypothetical protein